MALRSQPSPAPLSRRKLMALGLSCVATTATAAMLGLALSGRPAQAQTTPTKPGAALPHLKWSDLVPKGWDPAEEVRKHFKDEDFAIVSDSDPRMLEMLKQMREVWDRAPVNPDMDGVRGRIPGYVVPLEEGKQGLRELLLVPYYGACIHSPPPPANQIIHVVLSKPVKGFASMDTVWVTGTLKGFRGDTYMGVSGYKISDGALSRYVKEKPKPVGP